jgi:hypothetical protein
MGSYATMPAPAQAQASSLPERIQYAKALAEAELLPKEYRKRPANVLLAIETGDMLGIAAMAAISNIHVIDGKPSMSAGLMAALVRRAGHRLRVTGDDKHASASIVRADDVEFTFASEWTLPRAVQAGLCQLNKDGRPLARSKNNEPLNWEKYPAAMLKARAVAEACRDACPDVFLGPIYVPEELGAEVNADGTPIGATVDPGEPGELGEPTGRVELAAVDAELVEAPASVKSDEQWDAERAELVEADDLAGLQAMWKPAKAAGASNGVLHRIARDGKDLKATMEARADVAETANDAESDVAPPSLLSRTPPMPMLSTPTPRWWRDVLGCPVARERPAGAGRGCGPVQRGGLVTAGPDRSARAPVPGRDAGRVRIPARVDRGARVGPLVCGR